MPETPENPNFSTANIDASAKNQEDDTSAKSAIGEESEDQRADDLKEGTSAKSENKEESETGSAEDLKEETAENSSADSTKDNFGQQEKSTQDEETDKPMGLLDHLNELRMRLVKAFIAVAVCFGICWAFVDPLFGFLVNPLLAALPAGTHAQYTTLPEAFFTRMHIAFVAAIFLASPVIFYQVWAFVAPGLYDNEKRYIIPIAILSAIFFIAGAAFCYLVVFPFAFNFFLSYSTPDIEVTPKISDYLSFTLKLLFAFGIIFEMPIFTLFLARLGIVTAKLMRTWRKYAIVVIFVLAAILTPPDVVSQLLMACPMLLLYEVSIGVAAIFGKKAKKEEPEISAEEERVE